MPEDTASLDRMVLACSLAAAGIAARLLAIEARAAFRRRQYEELSDAADRLSADALEMLG